jgi:hypothetical protein
MQIHRVQHRATKIMLFEKVTEAQHRRFIRRRSHAEVHTHKPPQRRRLVERLLHAGIRQVEPLLQMEGIAWRWQSVDRAMGKAPLAKQCVGANPTDREKTTANAACWSTRVESRCRSPSAEPTRMM